MNCLPTLSQARLPEIMPEFLSSWLGVLILLGGLVLMGLTIVEKMKKKGPSPVMISPDPLRTQKVPELATRAEVEAIKADIDSDLRAMRDAMQEAERKSHSEVVAIHGRINLVAENTSAMKGRLEEIATSLHELVRRSMKS